MENIPEELKLKRFGYVVSAILLIVSNIALINEWSSTPLLFLLTMYFLTASLWVPALLKPFTKIIDKFTDNKSDKSLEEKKNYFSDN